MGDALGDVSGMGGDLGSHDALLHIVHIGQCQMLGGGHIAQEAAPLAAATAPPMAAVMWS